jgi:hypothetical protein
MTKCEPETCPDFKGGEKLEYDLAQYVGDRGMWTVIERSSRPIAKVVSRLDGVMLIEKLVTTRVTNAR